MRYHFIPIRMTKIKKMIVTSVGEDVEERKALYTAGGEVGEKK